MLEGVGPFGKRFLQLAAFPFWVASREPDDARARRFVPHVFILTAAGPYIVGFSIPSIVRVPVRNIFLLAYRLLAGNGLSLQPLMTGGGSVLSVSFVIVGCASFRDGRLAVVGQK